MKFITLSILCFLTTMLNAQNITQKQAIDFAEKLYQVEILSEKGRDALVKNIQEMKFENGGISFLADGQVVPSYDTELKVSVILDFCTKAFGSEYYYRTGSGEEGSKIQAEIYKDKDPQKTTLEEYEKLSIEYQKRISVLEGPSIELAIPIEDTLPDNFSYTIHLMSFRTGRDMAGYIHKKRSVVSKTRTRTLNDLLKIGLIDQRIYDETLPEIKSNSLYLEVYLLDFIVKRTVYYEDFDHNKKRELALIDKLKAQKLLSKKGYKDLLNAYKPFEIKSRYDYLTYCNNALVFDLKHFPKDPKVYYKLIFDEIKKIIPRFDFKNLTISIFDNPKYDKDFIEQNITISFNIYEKIYKTTFWHNFIKKNPAPYDLKDSLPPVREDFHISINKWLADLNSDKRLYFVQNIIQENRGNYIPDREFGLILMTKQQRNAWGDYLQEFSRESHDNTFNTEGVQKVIKDFEQIGLFNHLSKTEIDSAKQRVVELPIKSYAEILSCFPKSLVYFDWESGNLENPYEELTNEFTAASRGAFTPSDIDDNFKNDLHKKESTYFGFTFKAKRYETDLKMNDDWLDPKFMELIEKSLIEQHIDGKIYPCVNNGQEGGFVFLSQSQFKYLKQHYPLFFEK